jgi:pilus assembly protein CpaF
VIETSQIFQSTNGDLRRAGGFPPHPQRYESCGFDLADLLRVTPIQAES